jgi:hypothetical protein
MKIVFQLKMFFINQITFKIKIQEMIYYRIEKDIKKN